MSTLHQVNRLASIAVCGSACAQTDSIVLIEEAVSILLTLEELSAQFGSEHNIYVLETDARARGIPLPPESTNMSAVSLDEWVALCASHDRVVSW